MNHRFLTSLGVTALASRSRSVCSRPRLPRSAGPKGRTQSSSRWPKRERSRETVCRAQNARRRPDLQGYWTNNSYTPLERPNGVTKEFYTKEEFMRPKKAAEREEEQTTPGTVADVHYDFTQFGLDRSQTVVNGNMRTSLDREPAERKIPPVTSEGQKRAAEKAAERREQGAQYDQVQNIPIGSRCIYQGAGPPMMPPGYNPGYQIVQGPGYVMILIEAP